METNTQNIHPVLPPEPRPTSVWFDKKHVITYVIVFVGLIVIGSSIYAYQKSLKSTGVNPPINNQNQTQTSPTDWKTYTNTQYGFEFKYPNTSRVNDCGDKGAIYIDQDCSDLDSPEPMTLIFENVGNADSLITSYTESYKKLTNNNYEKTTKQIDGVIVTEFYGETIATEYSPSEKPTTIIFAKGNVTFLGGGSDKILIDQILSTFKFTK